MAPRTRRSAATPTPAPEPVVEETATEEDNGSLKRGPGPLAIAHAAYLEKTYGIEITPEQVYLAQSTRKEFRTTEDSGYEEALAEIDEAREAKEKEKEARAAERAAKAAETVTEPEPVAEPAKPATTRRRRAAASAEPATTTGRKAAF